MGVPLLYPKKKYDPQELEERPKGYPPPYFRKSPKLGVSSLNGPYLMGAICSSPYEVLTGTKSPDLASRLQTLNPRGLEGLKAVGPAEVRGDWGSGVGASVRVKDSFGLGAQELSDDFRA